MDNEVVIRRRAIEALRAGVPNRDVVRQLPPSQPELEDRFEKMLDETLASFEKSEQPVGMLLAGEFGAGKSHWLEYFRHLALEGGFICSTIVLNKETPLHDLSKIYRSAVHNAVAPGKHGPALEEIAFTYTPEKAPFYREMAEWIQENGELDPRYRATLRLFQQNPDEDLRQKIIAEWTGYPMKVGELKAALQNLGDGSTYKVTRAQPSQVTQRFEFLSRFFWSAGYSGWVLLVDETEMISRYSLRQRARAYANLGKLSGLIKGVRIPGVTSIFTITKDYPGQVLYGRKSDKTSIPARLVGTKDEEIILAAETGMNAIEKKSVDLRPPTCEAVQDVFARTRSIYSVAYDWQAPEIEDRREYSSSTAMRQYIRSWINTWDLLRIYDYRANTVAEDVQFSYEEDADMQEEADDGATITL